MKLPSAFSKSASAILIVAGLGLALSLTAASPEELAKESEAYCASTSSQKPTPQLIVDKVEKACALLKSEGSKAFPKFSGKDSEFIFGGTYIWVHDMDGKMLMHPIKCKMVGQQLLNLKDANGKLFFVEMNDLCEKKGQGWVDYLWPKPGEKAQSLKVSFVKLAECDGGKVVVGCGAYDISLEEAQKAGAAK